MPLEQHALDWWLLTKSARLRRRSAAALADAHVPHAHALPPELVARKLTRLQQGPQGQSRDDRFDKWKHNDFSAALTKMPLVTGVHERALERAAGCGLLEPLERRRMQQRVLLATKARRVAERSGDWEYRTRKSCAESDGSVALLKLMLEHQQQSIETQAMLRSYHRRRCELPTDYTLLVKRSEALRGAAESVLPSEMHENMSTGEDAPASLIADSDASIRKQLACSQALYDAAQRILSTNEEGADTLFKVAREATPADDYESVLDPMDIEGYMAAELEATRAALASAELLLGRSDDED
ncbi:hypothetical protein AB1Y20_010568 [Prymnesium parvum]|uniref:Uncharacterized protein n=1 Tax=Prymnesium parvum TaxID=97485 RepID=A0AB34IRS7_PRYPA